MQQQSLIRSQITPTDFTEKDLDDMFNEFMVKKTNLLDKDEFLNYLKIAKVDEQCRILVYMIKGLQKIDRQTFKRLFRINYADPNFFKALWLHISDEELGVMVFESLDLLNVEQELGLSEEDIQTMIDHSTKETSDGSIQMETVQQILMKI